MIKHPVYEMIKQQVTDEFEQDVLHVLVRHAGKRVTRPQLVFELTGKSIAQSALGNSTDDRKVRQAIEHLQLLEFPILASSGEPGYILATSDTELDAYLAEISSRQTQLLEKEQALRRSRRWIRVLEEFHENGPMQQASMFSKPVNMP